MEWTNLHNTLNSFANEFITRYKDYLTASDHIASRSLIDTMRIDVVRDDQTFEVNLTLNEYWKYIENGTKPHFPPPDAIREWIRVKPVLPRPLENGKLPTENQLAYLIGKHISIYGTKGTNDYQNAFDDTYYKFVKEIKNAIQEDIKNEIIFPIL